MRRQPRSAYYVSTEGAEQTAMQIGMAWLAQASQPGQITEAWIVLPARVSLLSVSEGAMERPMAIALDSNITLAFSNNVPLKRFTEQTLPYVAAQVNILVAFPTAKLLERLDSLVGVNSIALATDSLDTFRSWIEKWGALPIRVQPKPEADADVEVS